MIADGGRPAKRSTIHDYMEVCTNNWADVEEVGSFLYMETRIRTGSNHNKTLVFTLPHNNDYFYLG